MTTVRKALVALGAGAVALAAAGGAFYFTRIRTTGSVKRLTSYDTGYNLYSMDVRYDYDLERIIASGIKSDQGFLDAAIAEALPFLPVHATAPSFACSAFRSVTADGAVIMGRNYDFSNNTSAMLVHTSPDIGYESIGFAALDNLSANDPDAGIQSKLACLAAPFTCLDGINEKGVSIAVLTLDSKPTRHGTGKPVIATTLAIRLVLDRAATTEEAVALLGSYDMLASGGRDYHFFISDATGDSRVVEYDCMDEARPMAATPVRTVTNFFELYKDQVLPNQHNGILGHGRERYDAIEAVLDRAEGNMTVDAAWEALRAAAQEPSPDEITSNTQWSVVFDNTNLTAAFSLHRDWGTVNAFGITGALLEG